MKKVIIISSVAAVVAGLGTGIGVGVKKNLTKKAMLEEFDVTIKALIANLKMNNDIDLQLVHNYETSLMYKLEHDVPLKEADGIAEVRAMETELNDILYRLSSSEDDMKENTIRVVSDIMMSSIDSMNRDIQRRADARAALASAASTAVNLTGNVATAVVAYASTVEKMEERNEKKERLETKEG